MARFEVKFQTIRDKKIISTAGTTVEANSEREARQKFKGMKIPTNTVSYRILSVIKR